MPAKSKAKRAQPALSRIYHLLEQYLAAIETSFDQLNQNDSHAQSPEARESDARMLNALARTLEKLARLEQVAANGDTHDSLKQEENRRNIRDEIERRIARLMDSDKKTKPPQQP